MSSQVSRSKKRTQRDYTMSFKLSVVRRVEKGEFNYRQAQKHFGIQGACTVLAWLRKYGTFQWNTKTSTVSSQKNEQTPEQRIKQLEAALEVERQKNLFLTTAIQIAEQQYGVPIAKKSFPKQQENCKPKKS